MTAKKVKIIKTNELRPVYFENVRFDFSSTIGRNRTIDLNFPSLDLKFSDLWIVNAGLFGNNKITFYTNDNTIKIDVEI